MTRTGWNELTAVKESKICATVNTIIQGIRYPIGMLYFAKFMHPTLFEDINPTVVHEEMLQRFFGEELNGIYAYPEILTIVDETGMSTTVVLPVERIVVFAKGWAEIVYALECGDLIVGRCEHITFPPSIVEKTIARNVEGGVTPIVNLEVLIDLDPDLVLGTQREVSDPEVAERLRDCGIPLVGGNSANFSNIESMVITCGRMLNKEEKAAEIIEWLNQYKDLVADRVSTLSESEKPTFYYECNRPYLAYGVPHPCSDLVAFAGGRNFITDSSLDYVTLSSEYILEQNPEVIIKQVSFLEETATATPYQAEINEMMARTGWNEITAVEDGRIYASVNTVLQGIRYPVGMLYFAKCLHPTLFEDIDPAAIHEELLQTFFGEELEGIFTYP
jgi:iron complex transport system substrate-binding protein